MGLTEEQIWEEWERGESRCPYCVDLDERDFDATCDCSRWSLERFGVPVTIWVNGHPESAVTVKPHTIVR